MRSSRPKATQKAALELLQSIWVVVSKLSVLLFTVGCLLLNLVLKLAQILLKAIKSILRYVGLGLKKLWAIREAKGFVVGFVLASILAVFLYTQYGVVEVQQITSTPQTKIENVETISIEDDIEVQPVSAIIEDIAQPEVQVEVDWNNIDFVSLTYSEKINMLEERLRFIGVPESELDTYTRIATAESCKGQGNHPGCMNPTKTPPVVVKHCKSANTGNWYVVEINSNGGQAQCSAGDIEGMNEQSMGIFQILETTWNGHKCEGDRTNWLDQVSCAKKIRDMSGFKSWSTY